MHCSITSCVLHIAYCISHVACCVGVRSPWRTIEKIAEKSCGSNLRKILEKITNNEKMLNFILKKKPKIFKDNFEKSLEEISIGIFRKSQKKNLSIF